jgi:glutaredoxin
MIPFPHQKTWLFSTDATESSSSNTPAVGTASSSPRSSSMIQLYQYAICPFCNRVKALLDYAGMKYQTIEVNPLTKAEIRPFGYTKVPILTIAPVAAQNHEDEDDVQPIMDSAKIVQGLLEMEEVQTQLHTLRWNDSDWNLEKFQNGPRTQFVIDLAVNDLAAVLYPNMCRSFADSYRAFHYVHSVPSFAPIQRILIQTIGSVAMYMAATRVKSTYQDGCRIVKTNNIYIRNEFLLDSINKCSLVPFLLVVCKLHWMGVFFFFFFFLLQKNAILPMNDKPSMKFWENSNRNYSRHHHRLLLLPLACICLEIRIPIWGILRSMVYCVRSNICPFLMH